MHNALVQSLVSVSVVCLLFCATQDDAKEIQKAVDMLKSVEWKLIRAEKFPLTPIVLFDNFTSTIESMISRHAAEMNRRREWLARAEPAAEEGEEEAQTQSVGLITSTTDKYGVALLKDGFFQVTLSPCSIVFAWTTLRVATRLCPQTLATTGTKFKLKKNVRARWT